MRVTQMLNADAQCRTVYRVGYTKSGYADSAQGTKALLYTIALDPEPTCQRAGPEAVHDAEAQLLRLCEFVLTACAGLTQQRHRIRVLPPQDLRTASRACVRAQSTLKPPFQLRELVHISGAGLPQQRHCLRVLPPQDLQYQQQEGLFGGFGAVLEYLPPKDGAA